MEKKRKQENKNVLSAYIGIMGPETPKYLLANNFLSEFFQVPQEEKLRKISCEGFIKAGILNCEEDDEQKLEQLKDSFDRFFQRFSGLDTIQTNYENEDFYFPLRPQMLRNSKPNLRHLLYNMLPDVNRKENFTNLQEKLQEYLYGEATGVNYLLNEMCKKLFEENYQKLPAAKNAEFVARLRKKQYRRVCGNFQEDLYCLLEHTSFKKQDFYKKYDYLATLLNTYVIQFIVKKNVNSQAKGEDGCILCQGSATSHLLSGGAFHRACVQNYAKLSPDDIINLAHDEYIENGVQRLKANLCEILNRQDRIELNELTLLGMDKINAYISLLFLTVESDYDLVQDEFYGDLYVVKYEKPQEDNIFDAVENAKSVLVSNEEVRA